MKQRTLRATWSNPNYDPPSSLITTSGVAVVSLVVPILVGNTPCKMQ